MQRPRHPSARTLSHGCSASCLPIPRSIAAVALFAFPITASFCIETAASGQNLSRVESIDRLAEFTKQASDRFAVPARWISAVIQIESAGDEHAISSRGAMGLMQLMPGTWVELSVRYGLGLDPFDIPATTYWRALLTSRRCTTVSARRAFLRPTMQVRGDTNSTF